VGKKETEGAAAGEPGFDSHDEYLRAAACAGGVSAAAGRKGGVARGGVLGEKWGGWGGGV